MEIYKQEQICRNGETVRLCLWDPTISMIPKERATKRRNQIAAQKKKENSSIFNSILSVFKKKEESLQSDGPVLPFIEDFQADTNLQLAQDYLKSGTYQVAVFAFDVTSYVSFQEMEEWLDFFRENTYKSALVADILILGTKSDLLLPPSSIQEI